MDRDSVNLPDRSEHYIRDIIALKDFDKTKKEKDEALARLKVAEEQIKECEKIRRERDELANVKMDLDTKVLQIVEEILDQLDKPNPAHRTYRKLFLDSALPDRIEQHMEKVVNRRLIEAQNDELVSIWQAELTKQLKLIFSPWNEQLLGIRNDEKLGRLKNAQLQHPFVALKRNWQVPCSECNIAHDFKLLTEYDIAQFLKKRSASVQPGIIMRGLGERHTANAFLGDIVRIYLVEAVRHTNQR